MCQWNIICFYSVGLHVQYHCQPACSPRVTGVVRLPSDGSPQFLAYECLCCYFADRMPVYVVNVNNANKSVPTVAFHDGRSHPSLRSRADNEPGGLTAIAVGPTIQRVGPLQSRYCYIPKQLFYTAQQSTVWRLDTDIYIYIYILSRYVRITSSVSFLY